MAYNARYGPGKAVDGIYLPGERSEYSSLMVNGLHENPWWRVDLLQLHCVTAVNILNRAGVPNQVLQTFFWKRKVYWRIIARIQ